MGLVPHRPSSVWYARDAHLADGGGALLSEVVSVVSRDKIRRYVNDADVEDLLRIIRAYCRNVELTREATSAVSDPKDLYLLSLA